MDDDSAIQVPDRYEAILARSRAVQFQMNSDLLTGPLLPTLVVSKSDSSLLELGTGAGLGTCWILAGMDAGSSLISVENDRQVLAIARDEVGADPRLTLIEADGADFLETCIKRFDFIYADTWPAGHDESCPTHRNAGSSAGFFRHQTHMVDRPDPVREAMSLSLGAS